MKNYLFVVLLIFVYCQNSFSQELTLVGSYRLDHNKIAHTFKVSNDDSNTNINYTDELEIKTVYKNEIEVFIREVSEKKDVLRVSYDNATNTITVISNDDFKIEFISYLINSFEIKKASNE